MSEPAAEACEGQASVLDALCRSALMLLESTRQTPARLRLESNGTCVEIEWPASAGAPRPAVVAGAGPLAGLADGLAAGTGLTTGTGLAPGTGNGLAAGTGNGLAAGTAGLAAGANGLAAAPAAAPGTALAAGPAGPIAGPGEFCLRSPMVGTFYRAAEPGAAPFVQVGDPVETGQQVGIVEVMKLMTPVEADRPGRVVAILADDAVPVEHGQPLITCAAPDRPGSDR